MIRHKKRIAMENYAPHAQQTGHIQCCLPDIKAMLHGSHIENEIISARIIDRIVQVAQNLIATDLNDIEHIQMRTERAEKRFCIGDSLRFHTVPLAYFLGILAIVADLPAKPRIDTALRCDDIGIAHCRHPASGFQQWDQRLTDECRQRHRMPVRVVVMRRTV